MSKREAQLICGVSLINICNVMIIIKWIAIFLKKENLLYSHYIPY